MNDITYEYKNQAALDRAVKLWQKRLRLQDWAITATLVRGFDFGSRGEGQLGSCGPDVQNSMADIYILDAVDFVDNPDFMGDYDAEETLVHEMLHVILARMPVPPRANTDLEIVINKLAGAFVRAYRE